jgi:hypothetical protein
VRVRNPDPSYQPPPGAGSVSFRVPTGIVAVKFLGAAVLALGALFVDNRSQTLILLLAAAAVAAYGGRDVFARERLRADSDGVIAARGYSSRRVLAWSEIERLRVYETSRLGARSEMLEVDTGDELFLFSRFDLGVEPEEALRAVEAVRPS